MAIDEELWAVPAHWWERAEPFRGHGDPRPRVIAPGATTALRPLLGRSRPYIDRVLEHARAKGLGEIADATAAYLAAPDTESTPVGAAVTWMLVRLDPGNRATSSAQRNELVDLFLDSWIQDHGLAFAATAVIWRRYVHLEYDWIGNRWHDVLTTVGPGDVGEGYGFDSMAGELRARLAAAPETDYRTVVRALARLRADPGTRWARLATSYLLPDQQHWLDADLADLSPLRIWFTPVTMLVTSLTTPTQLARFREIIRPDSLLPAQMYSLLTQVGEAAVPHIAEQLLDKPILRTEFITPLVGILAETPSDAAYQALLDRSDNKHVAAALTKASTRYPRRAMRLLSRQAVTVESPLIVHTLRRHAVAYPELIAEYADEKAVPLLASVKRLPAADPEQLPAVLRSAPPKRGPKPPKWLSAELLPQLRLRDGTAALPEAAGAELVAMLMAWGPDGDHPAVAGVLEAVDPTSMADFAWAIFQAWELAAYPSKSGWVLHTLALVGNDETIRRLVPYINLWPSRSGSARAVEAVRVVAAIGGDVALMHLHGIAKRTRFGSLRAAAQEQVDAIARDRGLSEEDLDDRVVPHLGLATDSTLTLNYGPRQFTIGLDRQLRPSITAAGARLRTLPKPNATDDPDLAPAAYKSFRDFSKELKTATTDQIRRFESAMVDGRRWRATAFRTLIIEHPVLGPLAQRLVWVSLDAEGTITASFRIDQDRSLADADDEPYNLPDEALVGVAHPLHLEDSLERWRSQFSDYELLQPFDQLERGVHRFTPEEATSNQLFRFVDRTIATGKAYGLRQRGWELSYDALYRRFPGNRTVRITLSPGIEGGYRYEAEEQRIVAVELEGGTFDQIDPMSASELLRHLERLSA